jgi:hypothetical protein
MTSLFNDNLELQMMPWRAPSAHLSACENRNKMHGTNFAPNYETSIAISYDFLINIIVECVLCLVINYTSRELHLHRSRGFFFSPKKKSKSKWKLIANFLISFCDNLLFFTFANWKRWKITSQFETWLGHGHVFIARTRARPLECLAFRS